MSGRQRLPAARQVFLDSSGYLALVNPRDSHHQEARRTWTELTEERWQTVTTHFVIAETHSLFLVRLGRTHATAFLRQFERSSTTIVRVHPADEQQGRAIVFGYEDKDFSLTDTTSFAVMERFGIRHAFTFDRHFAQYGFLALPE